MLAPNNSDVSLTFYNDKVKEIIDPAIMAEPFTYVPIVAGHMELVGGNAVVFGNITEGYDVISPDISVDISYLDESALASSTPLAIKYQAWINQTTLLPYTIEYPFNPDYNPNTTYNQGDQIKSGTRFFKSNVMQNKGNDPTLTGNSSWIASSTIPWMELNSLTVVSYRRVYGTVYVYIPFTVVTGTIYTITAKNVKTGLNLTATYTAQAGDTVTQVKAGLHASLIAQPGYIAGYDSGVMTANVVCMFDQNKSFLQTPQPEVGTVTDVYSDFTFNAYILNVGNTVKLADLKCGASHSFGIVYKDRSGRQTSVMKTDALTVYIPFYTEDAHTLSSIAKLKFKIGHMPPSWAQTYEIVYFGNNTMDTFLQIRESQITKLLLGTNRYSLNIAQTLAWTYKQNNRWDVAPWSWLAGDRIRLIGTIDPTTGVVTLYNSQPPYDYEIEQTSDQYADLAVASAGDWLIFQAKNHPTDLDLGASIITNLTGNLNGVVVYTTANDPTKPTARVDTITLTGTSGTATIKVGTLSEVATWNASGLTATATDFKNSWAAAYLAVGIVLTSNGASLIFTASVAGTDFLCAVNVLVELYRPKKGFNQNIAYGTGMVFDIATDANGNHYHRGDVDQVFNSAGACTTLAEVNNTIVDAIGNLTTRANDCWKYVRLNYKFNTQAIQPFWCESMFPSDWWGGQIISNKLTSAGFPFVDDLSLKQTILPERLRHGGFIITGTRTNNIAHFTYDTYVDLPEKDGEITGLREIGYTLKVIQQHKETSIYINRVQTFNPDGTDQFNLTDAFLGSQRPMEDDYGCQHPDSIMVNNRNLYYWDNNEGVFIRSDPNGQKVLSGPEYKMSRYFKDLLRWIQTSGGSETLQVRIGANNDHQEIWLSFRMGDDVRGLIFSEKNDRYISRIDQITESYLHLGNFFAHLYHQTLWIMNIDEGQGYLSWSGNLTHAELEVVSNIEPMKNKVFTAIALFADNLLQSLSKYIRIPQEASGSNELMESNVSIWNRREGVYYGEILKDEHSHGSFINVLDAKLNGRTMRGRYAFVRFKTEEHTEKVRIDSVVIMSTPSERNV